MSDNTGRLNEIRKRHGELFMGEGYLFSHAEAGLLIAEIARLQAIVDKLGKQLEAANVLAECAAGTAALLGMTYAINIGSRPGWLDKLDDAVAAYRKAKENAE